MFQFPQKDEDQEADPTKVAGTPQGSKFLILMFIAVAMVFTGGGAAIRLGWLEPREIVHEDITLPVADNAPSDHAVEFGTYLVNFYGFEASQKTFSANGWVWMRWPAKLQKLLERRKIEPVSMIRFVNQVDAWDFNIEAENETPELESDGRYYQRFRFSGNFYVNHLDFRKYPFHKITLPLNFELEEKDFPSEFTDMKLLIDRKGSGVGRYIDIMGYNTTEFSQRMLMHQYATIMNGHQHAAGKDSVQQVRFEVTYQQSTNSVILRILLPLLIVMIVVLFSPSLPPRSWELRISIPPTIVLSLIFLQQGYQSTLPQLPYITPMDTLYNTCYVINLVFFALYIWDIILLNEAPEGQELKTIRSIERLDRRVQLLMTLLLLVSITLGFEIDLNI